MFRFVSGDMFFGVRWRDKTRDRFSLGGAEGHGKVLPRGFGFEIRFNLVSNSSFKANGSRLS